MIKRKRTRKLTRERLEEIIRILKDRLELSELYHLHRIETFDLDEQKETAERDDELGKTTEEYVLKLRNEHYSPYEYGLIKNLLAIDCNNKEYVEIQEFEISGIEYVLDGYRKWLLVPSLSKIPDHFPTLNRKHLREDRKFVDNLYIPLEKYVEKISLIEECLL